MLTMSRKKRARLLKYLAVRLEAKEQNMVGLFELRPGFPEVAPSPRRETVKCEMRFFQGVLGPRPLGLRRCDLLLPASSPAKTKTQKKKKCQRKLGKSLFLEQER